MSLASVDIKKTLRETKEETIGKSDLDPDGPVSGLEFCDF